MFNRKLKKRVRKLELQVSKLIEDKDILIEVLLSRPLSINDMPCVFDEIKAIDSHYLKPEQIRLRHRNIKDLSISERLKNILMMLIYKNKDQRFQTIFELYTENQIKNTRNIGVKLFNELEVIRKEAGLNYKK